MANKDHIASIVEIAESEGVFATAPGPFSHERLAHWDGVCVRGSNTARLNGMNGFRLSPSRFYSRKRISSRNPSARFGVRDAARANISIERGTPVIRPERTVGARATRDTDLSSRKSSLELVIRREYA